MTVRIDGTNSTANPAITGADTDTGLQLGTDEIQFVTGGTNRFTVESNGNLTIEDGNLIIGTDGHGINFGAVQGGGATSDLLDDYEEGTWTPAFKTVNGGETVTYGEQAGRYTKIGNVCYVELRLVLHGSTGPSGGSGGLRIDGLPYGVKTAAHPPYMGAGLTPVFVYNWATNTPQYFNIFSHVDEISLYRDSDNNVNGITDLQAGSYLSLSGCYLTA